MANASSNRGAASRPLSPHLQVYTPKINMIMSIVHRLTGAALYFGTLLLAFWLIAVAHGPDSFATADALFGSILGRLILIGYTWALLHHMFGGIRHLVWDTGRGYDLETVDRICWASLIASLVLTVLIWLLAAV
ncbi:MAG: succinate dehydrogenase, cytochrome b556 subunit [Hyphomicrobiaceae bacterium]